MNTQAFTAVPEVPGIDLEFCPRTYFLPPGIDVTHLAHISGHVRRETARELLAAGKDDIPPELLAELLDDNLRNLFGSIHPMYMGGEYLPKLAPDEIEIARISLASVTADQISVRARRRKNGIRYRIVDEYEDCPDTNYVCRPATSRHPLTMRALVAMIDGACEGDGPVFCWFKHNLDSGSDLAELRDFVTVGSEFYPELGRYYGHRLKRYLDDLERERSVTHSAD